VVGVKDVVADVQVICLIGCPQAGLRALEPRVISEPSLPFRAKRRRLTRPLAVASRQR
jgi:hypothetical protein